MHKNSVRITIKKEYMRNRNPQESKEMPAIMELIRRQEYLQAEADKITQGQRPDEWPVRDLKLDKIKDSTDPTAGMVISTGLPGSMFGCMGGAALAASLKVAPAVVYGAGVAGAGVGFGLGMWAARSLPCSPFRDCLRVGELYEEYKEIEQKIEKLRMGKSD